MSIYKLTADELAPDILELIVLHREGKLHEAIVRQALKGACWWVSNNQGKNDSCSLWSTKALALRNANDSWKGLGLIHEHIIPRNIIEEEIMKLVEPSVEKIANFLKLSQVCVVTKDEDESLCKAGLQRKVPGDVPLPDGGNKRYFIAGIEFSEVPYQPPCCPSIR
jgi:hypothetical protein